MLGVVATIALCIYALYFYALVKLIPITLTLPGIAGLVLTLGVAADANIVVFERVKEEVRAGRSIGTAIATGYRKGLTAIIDANIVTFLVAFILFIIATAGVQGFAFTLGLGVIVSLFTAVLATQAILYSLRGTRLIRSKAALGAGEQKRKFRFDYMGKAKWFFSLSGLILLVCALAMSGKGINFGIDFDGGTRITAAAGEAGHGRPGARRGRAARPRRREDPDAAEPRARPARRPDLDQGAADGRRPRGRREALNSSSAQADARTSRRSARASARPWPESAIYAIIASLLIISIYIALRFEWKFAVPVLIALMHDILIVAGVYALTGREVTTSTVAALLTILGYSLYDTIIVFDRVRENIPRMPSAAFSQIVNRSLSEVIVRSLATSFCTLLPVLALMLFGGETLRDFAFALLIGIASGTYSSIFIATPVLQHWKEREPGFRARRARILERARRACPPYATAEQGGPIDVQPKERGRKRRVSAPPGQEVSAAEFQEMVRDLGVEEATPARQPAARRHRGQRASRRRSPRSRAGRGRNRTTAAGADADLVRQRRDGDAKDRKARNRRHGRPR